MRGTAYWNHLKLPRAPTARSSRNQASVSPVAPCRLRALTPSITVLARNRPRRICHAGTGQRRFWATLKLIANVFKPDAMPESYRRCSTDDERYYVPISETVIVAVLSWISPSETRWAASWRRPTSRRTATTTHTRSSPTRCRKRAISSTTGPRPPATSSTRRPVRNTPSSRTSTIPMRVFFNVKGPHLARRRRHVRGHFDVHDYIAMAKEHYEEVGNWLATSRSCRDLSADDYADHASRALLGADRRHRGDARLLPRRAGLAVTCACRCCSPVTGSTRAGRGACTSRSASYT